MAVPFPGTVAVATCIACGARSRGGECPDGCEDVALDLVDVAAVESARRRVAVLEARVVGLRALAGALADGADPLSDALRAQAVEALAVSLPPVTDEADEAEIVLAWGCPVCGRVDAPQPCLGVCVRKPVEMTDAAVFRQLSDEAARLVVVEKPLAGVAMFVAHGAPRPGAEGRAREALRARAGELVRPAAR